MTDRAREVLDMLLGRERDIYNPDKLSSERRDTCIYMLASFCPFELFRNTRRSIGKCRYGNHEEYYRAEYNKNGRKRAEEYEWELLRLLVEIVLDVRNVAKKCTASDTSDLPLLERIKEKEELFKKLYESIEQLGMEGKVEEACHAFDECEKVKWELERIKEAYYAKNNGEGMGRCTVCGAGIVLSDTKVKIDRHIKGRLHKGHLLVRSKLADLLEKFGITSVAEIFPDGFLFKHLRSHPFSSSL
ncbi:U1 snRNP protein [Encephalitozoon intestinalis ATCC 50506]|uniref:U1 snRNP protein n=1 Tax=Encephalitozoon intestinalis (strain ATCC 50506) TaxID=876142 RepID=E0S9M0_ENCIT|nr:U1 snRNP protein [Encephalitozoon intestinalis ATCC 50506]ADM12405.1 U1 snRNP protein [Encephalitozoon intestinalis ATCC 50506]UTX46238.1 Luc7-like protein [Encephalitozoon intestinalis]